MQKIAQICQRYSKLWYSSKKTSLDKLIFHEFADSDWASNLDDRKSCSGYCVFLGPNLVSWSSKKQLVVARSSTEAEFRALAHIACELSWLFYLSTELHLSLQPPIVWSDNLSAAALASNPIFHAWTKHIELDIYFVRDKVLNHELNIRYVPTAEQTTDIFTKALGTSRFLYLRDKLNVIQLV